MRKNNLKGLLVSTMIAGATLLGANQAKATPIKYTQIEDIQTTDQDFTRPGIQSSLTFSVVNNSTFNNTVDSATSYSFTAESNKVFSVYSIDTPTGWNYTISSDHKRIDFNATSQEYFQGIGETNYFTFHSDVSNFTQSRFDGTSTYDGAFNQENVLAPTIPEPNSLALGAFSLLSLLGIRRFLRI